MSRLYTSRNRLERQVKENIDVVEVDILPKLSQIVIDLTEASQGLVKARAEILAYSQAKQVVEDDMQLLNFRFDSTCKQIEDVINQAFHPSI